MTTTAVFSLELASGALTRWEGPAPCSLCRHEGHVLTSDGTHLLCLSGDTDDGAPIPVRFTLPATDCGEAASKRLRGVRLTGVLGGPVTLAARSDADIQLLGKAAPVGRDGLPGSSLARLGRGYGRFWRFMVSTEDGEPLDIAAIEPVFVVLDRRVG